MPFRTCCARDRVASEFVVASGRGSGTHRRKGRHAIALDRPATTRRSVGRLTTSRLAIPPPSPYLRGHEPQWHHLVGGDLDHSPRHRDRLSRGGAWPGRARARRSDR
ncbi:hypothetical protein SPHINGO8AM_40018 [Sphingomonas sp. 8AM]|nr:hypothetical protein SPHINGO8AM_40018 [Sphingomonas sp. 8AM]